MPRSSFSRLFFILLLAWLMPSAYARDSKTSPGDSLETISADHVRVELIAPDVLESGENTIGFRFTIDPEWHVYWKNPGDSGQAPKFDLISNDAQFSSVSWPTPKRVPVADLTNIGYETEVTFPLSLRPNDLAKVVKVEAKLQWLVCKIECLPGEGVITFQREVGDKTKWKDDSKKALDEALKAIPSSMDASPWTIQSVRLTEDNRIALDILHKTGKSLAELEIFPSDGFAFLPAKPELSEDGKSQLIRLQAGQSFPIKTSFLLVSSEGAFEHDNVSLGKQDDKASENVTTKSEESSWSTFLILLLSAFAGGVILNLMPCVLPVLSIKFFSMAKMNQKSRWHEIWLYTLGVLVTFTALGGLFLALRAGGAAVGWGFQLQSPPIVMALVLLFWVMGLSFLGLFEFGHSLVQAAGRFQHSGAFATGVLSVFVATPCTGPFMGTALGAAATLPALQALTIFFFLGLGLAFPFLLLALFPHIKLPKPGLWMITLRQFLAFPLFATVIWLLWVLGLQLGQDAWFYATSLCLLLSFVIWLGKGRHRAIKLFSWAVGLLALAYTGRWVVSAPLVSMHTAKASTQVTWADFDPELVKSTRGKQGIFIDFTATWCVTCQVNKKAVLETDAAEKLFLANDVKLIRADWTNVDEKITVALAEFGRASVPLYLYYPKDGSAPKILPQILTIADIEGLFP